MINVRQAKLEDKAEIFKFLDKAYQENSRFKYPQRWTWQFINNPYKKDQGLPVWIAVKEDGTVVGQSCAMYEPLKIGADVHRLAWALDAYILPEYRGLNLGFETLRANQEDNDLWMGLIMAESSRHILTKLGCQPIDNVTVFKRISRFDAESPYEALRIRLSAKWGGKSLLWLLHTFHLDWLAAKFINLGVWIQDLRLPRYVDSSLEITQVDEFDQRINEFCERVSTQFKVIVQRDCKFLNWKYVEQPFMDYEKFIAFRNGIICGYIILRHAKPPESNSGIIADLFVSPDDKVTINSLLVFALMHFKQQKVKYIFAASSINAFKTALKSLRFNKQKDVVPLLYCNSSLPIANEVFGPGSWFLGRSDHDWDQYPYG